MFMFWGRGLAIGGLIGLVIGLGPAAILVVLPASASDSFWGILAVLLSLSVAPISAVVLSAGVLLLLFGLLRRGRG
jgi:hypothetical protein